MKAPTRESKKVAPEKFVSVLAEFGRSKCITYMKYRTMLTMFAIKPMLSNAVKTVYTKKLSKKMKLHVFDNKELY